MPVFSSKASLALTLGTSSSERSLSAEGKAKVADTKVAASSAEEKNFMAGIDDWRGG